MSREPSPQPADYSTPPAQPIKPGIADIGWILLGCIPAGLELARARRILAKIDPKAIALRNEEVAQLKAKKTTKTERITYIIPRLAKRLPWRADCLVQAIAAQNWLASHGHSSKLVVGIQVDEGDGFGSHAWLLHAGEVAIGGDVEDYTGIIAD